MNELNKLDIIFEGLAYTVLGIAVVFIILAIIMLVINAMALFSGDKKLVKKANQPENETAEAVEITQTEQQTDDSELVAVITAAIAAMTDQSATGFVVRSYKKISGGAWNKAGRMEVLDNRL